MHPLSIFPALLTFELLSPFLLRVAVSIFIFYIGKKRYSSQYKWTSIVYILTGIFILIGLYTQVVVIVGVIVLKFDFWINFWKARKTVPISKETYFLYFLAGIILLSLLFTGPGFLAFDLPL